MLIIGELINGMYKQIGTAIQAKDASVIRERARSQVEAGALALDVNCGPASIDPVADIQWLVWVIQEVTDIPLSIDSSKPQVIEAGLKLLKKPGILNSTTADAEKLAILIPLAQKYDASLIGIAIDEQGIPNNKEQRIELAARIVSTCMDRGFPVQKIYLDPIVLPLNMAQAQMRDILESIHDFKLLSDPAPGTIIGLSNVSQGSHDRKLINRTFLTMALAQGLDAAILDPTDTELVNETITAEVVLNKHIYCDSFLQAYRRRL